MREKWGEEEYLRREALAAGMAAGVKSAELEAEVKDREWLDHTLAGATITSPPTPVLPPSPSPSH